MTKYIRKDRYVDAFKWTGGPDQTEDPEWAIDAIKDGRITFANAGTKNVIMLVHDKVAKPGDWIVNDDGSLLIYSDRLFSIDFEAA